jgi:hypothetical protein
MFWINGEWNPIEFLSNFDLSPEYHFELPRGYLEILLNNDDLGNSLRQRSEWHFGDFGKTNDLIGLIEKEPTFFRNTHILSYIDYDGDISLHKLGLFVSLTCLDFSTNQHFRMDLDAMATFCPLLQILALGEFYQFQGSLAPLQYIRDLKLFMQHPGLTIEPASPFSSLLPIHSANVLTHLDLDIPMDSAVSFESMTSNPFDAFVKVTDLKLSIINSRIIELFADTSITSIVALHLELTFDGIHALPSGVPRMLSAASLMGLRRLTVSDDTFCKFDTEDFYDLVDITTLVGFQHLEYLDISFPFPGEWWSEFESMRKLEFLCVWVDLEEYDWEEFDCDEKTAAVKELCGPIFSNRDRKIRVVVKEWDSAPWVTIFDDWF